MNNTHQDAVSRRLFLKFLAGSPLLASFGWLSCSSESPEKQGKAAAAAAARMRFERAWSGADFELTSSRL